MRIPRRLALGCLVLAAASSVGFSQTTDRREPTLRDRLTNGLQARRPSEIAFVEATLDTVDRGELRQDLVNRVFFWARTRPQNRRADRRPIIYFQPALERIAQKGRVVIRTDEEAASANG